jgi:hypothetical protein
MPSTFSTNLKIELMATGENSGTWGTTTNTNLGTALEQSIVGYVTVSFASDANKTLTLTDSNAAQDARAVFLNLTSAVSLTATRDLIVPAVTKNYIVKNGTTGGQSIRVIVAGAGVTIPNGKTVLIYNDGTDVLYQFDHVGALDLGGALTAKVATFTPDARASGVASYFTVTTPSDTGQTASTESIGANFTAGTREWATGALTLQRERVFAAPTYAFAGASTLTTAVNVDIATPVAGTNATITNAYALRSGAAYLTSTLLVDGDGTFAGTGQVKLPSGTTAQRSGSPTDGMIRYNSTLQQFEGYGNSLWGGIGGAQAGGAIMTNKDIASVSYTIATGENGLSVGPITVDSGITITVSSGQRWLVL